MARFHLAETPIPYPRPRARALPGGGVQFYTPGPVREYMARVGKAAWTVAPRDPWEGPCAVRLRFLMPVPASWPKRRREAALAGLDRPCTTPDLDNLVKSILDGITAAGAWWLDDKQVVDLSAAQWYAPAPGVTVEGRDLSI